MERPINQRISSPKPSLLHVVVQFIILYNNSFNPVVLLENNRICIFMIILEKVSKGGEIVKNTPNKLISSLNHNYCMLFYY